MRRREFITLVGGATAVWPLMARGQQPAMPVVGFLNAGSEEGFTSAAAAFRNGLGDAGYVEVQNVTIDYHWLEGGYDRMPGLVADLVGHHVAVIVTPTTQAALAAKAATTTIPIVFGVAEDPVKLGLVASFARPGGNATGVNFFFNEVVPKRLELLHDLVPNAVRLAVLLNPANAPVTEAMLRNLPEAARALGFQVQVLHATTNSEIDAAFATIARDRADALFVAPDAFFTSRRGQFATLTARDRLPASSANRAMGRSRPFDELRYKPHGHVPTGRHLYRPDSQGREARRSASVTVNQIRTRH